MCIARVPVLLLALAPAALSGCSGPDRRGVSGLQESALRLVDLYEPSVVVGAAAPAPGARQRTEWRFDGSGPNGWSALSGVDRLSIRDGALGGVSRDSFPLLHVERVSGLDGRDVVHSVEVRARASAGANLSIDFRDDEAIDAREVLDDARDFPWANSTPLVADGTIRTYTLRPARTQRVSATRHLLLRPTDAAGAIFSIESVRIVTRHEHLASIPSGIGWQGLSEIYRESLIARSPEALRFPLRLPDRPLLDLAIGTVEDGPVTFTVQIARASGGASHDGDAERTLATRTLTRPHHWETVPVDLTPWAGEDVDLTLSLSSGSAGALGFWGAPVVRGRGANPGVILIWADTLRRDHLGIYGYERDTTPNLARLAKEGTLFADCHVNATWTKVSTPSLLTSLYPLSHGVTDFSDRIPASAVTLTEVYRDAGYATLGLSSVSFVGRFTNLHQGFEEFHEDTSLPDQTSSKTAREYVDRLLPWLEAHRDVPFFVLLHVTDPHDPFRPHPPYDTMWSDPVAAERHAEDQATVREVIADPLLKRFGMPTREELVKAGLHPDRYAQADRDWYDGSIRGMDAEIGRLVERLRELGLAESTMVLFTSDHGEEFLEHGRTFHGQSLYGELLDVPLVLWQPGRVPAGRVVPQTVETIDLMPTLLAASGLSAPEGMQGRSLLPLLSGELEARPAFAMKARTFEAGGGPPPREAESYSVIADGWKLVRHVSHAAGQTGPEFELFDARNDRHDQRDLAAANPQIVARLASKLESIRAKALTARLKPDSEAAGALSTEELERLRSLGYIQ